METVPDIFGTLIEVSVTLAGFSGLVFVFRTGRQIDEGTLKRIYAILVQCLVAGIAAAAPYFLIGLTQRSAIVIGVPLAFIGLIILWVLLVAAVTFWQGRDRLTSRWTAALMFISFPAAVLFLLSAFDIGVPRSYSMLVLAIVWELVLAGFAFATAVVRLIRQNGPEDT